MGKILKNLYKIALFVNLLFVVTIVIVFLAICALTFMETYLVVDDNLVKTDAIVVLMGGNTTRMPEAADLYMNGYADMIIIAQGISNEAAEGKRDAIELGVPEESIIIIPGEAMSTWDEALIVRDYLGQRKDIKSLILVNSSRQTRRTLTTFNRVLRSLDRDIILISRVTRYEAFQDERWWYSLRNIESIIIDSLKFAYYYFRPYL